MLKIFEPAEVLPVRVFHEPLHHRFVALPEGVLQEVKPHQEADRQPGASHLLDIEGTELLLEKSPVDFVGQSVQGVSSVEHVLQAGAEQVGLRSGVRGQFRLHRFTGFSWIYFNSRQLLHKSKAMKSIIIQYVARNSGTTNYILCVQEEK